MKETEVLQIVHNYISHSGLAGQSAARLFTDAHHTLLPFKGLSPFQRFTLQMGDLVLHPDLVGQFDDGESLFAIEAKGDDDLLKGLAQAEMYQYGFHYAYLAADASAFGNSLVDVARRKNIGVLAVGDEVRVVHQPYACMPLRDPYRLIVRQWIRELCQIFELENR